MARAKVKATEREPDGMSPGHMVRGIALFSILTCLGAGCSPALHPAKSTFTVHHAANGLLYDGGLPTQISLHMRPLGLSPDGTAQLLIVAHFQTAQGAPTTVYGGSDIAWVASRGTVQWQTRMRYGNPAAIFSVKNPGGIRITVTPRIPALAPQHYIVDVSHWLNGTHFVAKALGPHMIALGFFPALRVARTLIRHTGDESITVQLPAGTRTYRDTSVRTATTYEYTLRRRATLPSSATVSTPARFTSQPIANADGIGMWLYFTNNPTDDIVLSSFSIKGIIAQAVRGHLRYVELRTAYGAYWELTPSAQPRVDALIDGLAAHHIRTIGWTVPRSDDFADLSASVRTLEYRTARGNRFAGLAIDLERGSEFMGIGAIGEHAMRSYIHHVREAIGAGPLLVATVEDPALELSPPAAATYQAIARYANVLQPMSYWRMMSRHPTSPADVTRALRASFDRMRALSNLPISIGGQTTGEGHNGPPTPAEIQTSIIDAHKLGAIGICFFSWDGTSKSQWHIIGMKEF